jgi:hypothetical protein
MLRSAGRSANHPASLVPMAEYSIYTEMIRALVRRPRQGGCSPRMPGDPVNIPQDIKKRGVTTGTDPELNPEVNDPFRLPPQVRNRPGSTSQGGDTVQIPLRRSIFS